MYYIFRTDVWLAYYELWHLAVCSRAIYSHPVPSLSSFIRLKFRELAAHCCPRTRERERATKQKNHFVLLPTPKTRNASEGGHYYYYYYGYCGVHNIKTFGRSTGVAVQSCWRAIVLDLLRDGWIIQDIVLGFKYGGREECYSTYT